MRATVWQVFCEVAVLLVLPPSALAQAQSAPPELAQSASALMSAFPGGEPIALTVLSIAAGTLLLRLTKWLGLALTFATLGFLAVALLIAVEPQVLARFIAAVRHS
jgi:hypothetical protein